MSEIKVDSLTGKTSAGNITVTSGSATMQLQDGLVKVYAYVNQSGTHTAGDTLNVSSILDYAAGTTRIFHSNNMSSSTYCVSGGAADSVGYGQYQFYTVNTTSYHTGRVTPDYSLTQVDGHIGSVIHGDLA
jgi:hypothetical protein